MMFAILLNKKHILAGQKIKVFPHKNYVTRVSSDPALFLDGTFKSAILCWDTRMGNVSIAVIWRCIAREVLSYLKPVFNKLNLKRHFDHWNTDRSVNYFEEQFYWQEFLMQEGFDNRPRYGQIWANAVFLTFLALALWSFERLKKAVLKTVQAADVTFDEELRQQR